MNPIWTWIHDWQIHLIFRMLIAGLCGIAIGFERKNRAKEAGIRTHCIVACASALMMIISKYGFGDLLDGTIYQLADVRLDPSRMAQGIVTGVGFLGAGIIFIQRGAIRGLTTAAGVWATSGIGMAIGSGMYIIGISGTALVLLAQLILHNKNLFMAAHKTKTLKVFGVTTASFQLETAEKLRPMQISITDVSISKNEDGSLDYSFFLDIPHSLCEEELLGLFQQRCSIDFTH